MLHESCCNDRRDEPRAPERERDAVLRPTLVVERVVDRGHLENTTSAAGLEVSHLNDDREGLEYKHEGKQRQEHKESLLDGHRCERVADRERARATHEPPRPR